jgi:beta-N-acetylhexosaminidase
MFKLLLMYKKILLIFSFILISAALFGQKKVISAKEGATAHPAKATSVNQPAKKTTSQQPAKKTTVKQSLKVTPIPRSVKVSGVTQISQARSFRLIQREYAQKSVAVLKNYNHFVPLSRLDTIKMLVVSIGMGNANPMPQFIGRYIKADYLTIASNTKLASIRQNLSKSAFYNTVILVVGEQISNLVTVRQKENLRGDNSLGVEVQSLSETEKLLFGDFAPGTKMVYMLFGLPPFLSHWSDSERASVIIASEKADFDKMDLSAQLIFGAINSIGKLPFDLNKYKKGEGIGFSAIGRLSYVLPEELGMDSIKLSRTMDSLVGIGLKNRAFPGCQMVLAKKGKVFYQKSYGFHTYDNTLPVQSDDVYDLASVTKILAPVPALMMLADQKKFLVTKKMSDYWPDWKGSNKEGILVSDLLSHQARLRPGVTLWPRTLDQNGRYKSEYYGMQPTQGYGLRVSGNLYLVDSFPDTVYKIIRDSPLLKSKKYVYSDLGFVVLPKVIENLTGESYETFLRKKLYSRLGASSLMYNPYLAEQKEKIVPTEDDQTFRHELLQGFVHDETAALLGGISGNAGLFGSAGDVAKVMQLYLQEGEYGNERYITAETMNNWTSSHFQKTNNRRGFGFDKPAIRVSQYSGKERYPSTSVSEQSYGHSGYTGTFVWVDPANGLLFVFLSNRVFPDRDNHKINSLKLRPLLLETLFKMAGDKSVQH